MPSREGLGFLLGFIGVVIFGATLPMTRIAVHSLDPIFVTAGRACLAGLIAGPVLLLLRRRIPERDVLIRLCLVALCVVAGFPGFTGFAMQHVPSSHGGVVLGILPMATAIASALIFRERPSPAFWVAALVGAIIVIGFSLRDGGGRLELGDALLAGAVISASLGYVVSAQLTRSMPGWEVISWVVVVALPFTLPLSLLSAPSSLAAVSPQVWLAFLYLGVMSQYLGFFAWNAGLALGGVARVSQVQLLQTFVTLAVAAVLTNEPVDVLTWLSGFAVVGVVVIARRFR